MVPVSISYGTINLLDGELPRSSAGPLWTLACTAGDWGETRNGYWWSCDVINERLSACRFPRQIIHHSSSQPGRFPRVDYPLRLTHTQVSHSWPFCLILGTGPLFIFSLDVKYICLRTTASAWVPFHVPGHNFLLGAPFAMRAPSVRILQCLVAPVSYD